MLSNLMGNSDQRYDNFRTLFGRIIKRKPLHRDKYGYIQLLKRCLPRQFYDVKRSSFNTSFSKNISHEYVLSKIISSYLGSTKYHNTTFPHVEVTGDEFVSPATSRNVQREADIFVRKVINILEKKAPVEERMITRSRKEQLDKQKNTNKNDLECSIRSNDDNSLPNSPNADESSKMIAKGLITPKKQIITSSRCTKPNNRLRITLDFDCSLYPGLSRIKELFQESDESDEQRYKKPSSFNDVTDSDKVLFTPIPQFRLKELKNAMNHNIKSDPSLQRARSMWQSRLVGKIIKLCNKMHQTNMIEFLNIVLLYPSMFLKVLCYCYDKNSQLIILNTLCNSNLFQCTLHIYLMIMNDKTLQLEVSKEIRISYQLNSKSMKHMPTLLALVHKFVSYNTKNCNTKKQLILEAFKKKSFQYSFLVNIKYNETYSFMDIFNIRNILQNHRKEFLSGNVCNSLKIKCVADWQAFTNFNDLQLFVLKVLAGEYSSFKPEIIADELAERSVRLNTKIIHPKDPENEKDTLYSTEEIEMLIAKNNSETSSYTSFFDQNPTKFHSVKEFAESGVLPLHDEIKGMVRGPKKSDYYADKLNYVKRMKLSYTAVDVYLMLDYMKDYTNTYIHEKIYLQLLSSLDNYIILHDGKLFFRNATFARKCTEVLFDKNLEYCLKHEERNLVDVSTFFKDHTHEPLPKCLKLLKKYRTPQLISHLDLDECFFLTHPVHLLKICTKQHNFVNSNENFLKVVSSIFGYDHQINSTSLSNLQNFLHCIPHDGSSLLKKYFFELSLNVLIRIVFKVCIELMNLKKKVIDLTQEECTQFIMLLFGTDFVEKRVIDLALSALTVSNDEESAVENMIKLDLERWTAEKKNEMSFYESLTGLLMSKLFDENEITHLFDCKYHLFWNSERNGNFYNLYFYKNISSGKSVLNMIEKKMMPHTVLTNTSYLSGTLNRIRAFMDAHDKEELIGANAVFLKSVPATLYLLIYFFKERIKHEKTTEFWIESILQNMPINRIKHPFLTYKYQLQSLLEDKVITHLLIQNDLNVNTLRPFYAGMKMVIRNYLHEINYGEDSISN